MSAPGRTGNPVPISERRISSFSDTRMRRAVELRALALGSSEEFVLCNVIDDSGNRLAAEVSAIDGAPADTVDIKFVVLSIGSMIQRKSAPRLRLLP